MAALGALMIVAYVGMGLPTAALGVAWKSMRVDFHRPLSSLGVVVVTFTVGYLAATSTHRWSAARVAAPWLLVGASALAAAGAATFALTGSWPVLLGGAALLGLSAGTVDAALNAQVALHHSGRMMNLMHGGFGLGATLGPLLITALIGWGISWRWGYGALGVLQVALVVGFAASAPRWPSRAVASEPAAAADRPAPIIAAELGEFELVDLAGLESAADSAGPDRERVQRRAARLGPLVFLAYGAAEFAIGSWAFVLLTGRGLTTTAAGVCVTLYWGALAVGRLGLGALGTRLSPAQVLAGSVLGVMVGGVGLWVLPSLGAAAALVVLGLSLAGMFPALMALTPGRVGPARTPGVISNQLAAAVIGGAVWGAAVGVVAQHLGSAAIAPALLGSCALLAVTEVALSASTT